MRFPFVAIFIVTVFHQSGIVKSANILFWLGFGSQSTRISQLPLMEALVDKGHTVTLLSPLPQPDKDPTKKAKITHYQPKKWAEKVGTFDQHIHFYQKRKNLGIFPIFLWNDYYRMGMDACKYLYADPEFMEFIKTNKFDFVIMGTFDNECAYGPIHMWGAKYALFLTTTVLSFLQDPYGIPDESSSISEMSLLPKDRDNMSFLDRFLNAMYPIVTNFIRRYWYLPYLEDVTRKGLGLEIAKDLPSFDEMDRNTNLMFLTSHYSYDLARSLPPNIIQIGGNVVTKTQKPVPKEMKEFLDNSPNGFIYISFGTLLEFTKFDNQVQIEFIKALHKFPNVKFLWKSGKEITAAPLPANVMVSKWVPQQTILAHKNVRGYITHSGMGSTIEAIYFAVPLVCVPLLYDQDLLADLTVKRRAGVKVEILDMKQKDLENAIGEILQNKKYAESMKKLSAIFKDRPAPPMETAVWWIEYVLRHDNTNEYLIPPSAFQSWWKRRQIDVWAFFTMLLITVTTIPLILIICITKRLCGKKGNHSKSKLKKN